MTFLYRPDCKECIMVKNWLDKYGIEYEERDMNAAPPTGQELLEWSEKGRIGIKSFLRPRKFSLRIMLMSHQMSLIETPVKAYMIAAAHEHIACPIMVGDDFVVMGTENAQWRKALKMQ